MSKITNAKQEFLEETKYFKVVAAAIQFGSNYRSEEQDSFKLKPLYTKEEYENFLTFLDRDYNASYGGQEVYGIIFCEDGVWFDRGEYDGSEWWSCNKYPDLRHSFDEAEMLKYERSKKLKRIEDTI
jgi:hypothetical protein